ncbi:MAG: class I SAM-dependent methyltransferase [Limisphaerales bacterium]
MAQLIYRLKKKIHPPLPLFRLLNRSKEQFQCPICDYVGPFADVDNFGGLRKHAECPKCGARERHRVQYLVLTELFKTMDTSRLTMLHFAPEPFFRSFLSSRFGLYETADLCMKHVTYQADLLNLPFEAETYDFVFASHVLEHIQNDTRALREIRRILKPNGIAVLPVPVVCDKTVEYSQANPNEAYHFRAPGLDYFQKYESYFDRVRVYSSESLPEKHQTYIYEDRSKWPTRECPLRPPMAGERHSDFVPVCHA